MDIYARLKELGLELPPPPPPGGLYKPVKQAGNLLFVSGQGCTREHWRNTERCGPRMPTIPN